MDSDTVNPIPFEKPTARVDDLARLARLDDSVQDVYMLEYSPSNRAACSGRQPCNGTKIGQGQSRFPSSERRRGAGES